MCSSSITKNLESCAKSNFELADQGLNKRYREVASRLSEGDRSLLVAAQREWVRHKERTCQEAYESALPGQEAEIDRWTCLDQMTRTRTSELNYIDSGMGGDGFFRAVDIISRYYEHGDRNRFISKLVADSTRDESRDWQEYVRDTCILSARQTHEEENTCIARQQFYRY
ncbi:lysozyme inhibitor LprI family protein [Caballeronia glebae]